MIDLLTLKGQKAYYENSINSALDNVLYMDVTSMIVEFLTDKRAVGFTCVNTLSTQKVYNSITLTSGSLAFFGCSGVLQVFDPDSIKITKILEDYTCACVLTSGILIFANGCSLDLWNMNTMVYIGSLEGHSDSVFNCHSLGNNKIVSWSRNCIRIWDVKSQMCIFCLQEQNYFVNSTICTNSKIVTACSDGVLRIWDVKTAECIATLALVVTKCIVLPHGHVVCITCDHCLKVLDLETSTFIGELQRNAGTLRDWCILPNGNLVTASGDCTLKVWDTFTVSLVGSLEGHTGEVSCCSYLQHDKIVSASYDCSLKIWDKQTLMCISTLKGHIGRALTCSVLANGNIVSTSSDSTVKIWKCMWQLH